MKRNIFIVVVLVTGFAGCASVPATYAPIVDRPGPNYQQNLAECTALADGAEVVKVFAPGGAAVERMQRRAAVMSCLVGRGYRVVG